MSEKLFETILTRLVICVFFLYKSVERVQGAVQRHAEPSATAASEPHRESMGQRRFGHDGYDCGEVRAVLVFVMHTSDRSG